MVDFLPPDMPYKQNFASDTMAVESLAVPLSVRGRLAIVTWQMHLRPFVKRAFLRLPNSFRRLIVRVTNGN